MLRQILLTEKAKEIGTLLLTCAPTNIASNKTIQANGGRLVKTSFVERIRLGLVDAIGRPHRMAQRGITTHVLPSSSTAEEIAAIVRPREFRIWLRCTPL